jgi:phosphoribosylformylglycinamidine synthase
MYYMFAEAVAGMGEACAVLETPVTGGNVSFYNEDPERAVYPTPTIGMIEIIEDISHITTQGFKDEGDIVLMAGETRAEIGGSEYLKAIHGQVTGDAPSLDLHFERKLQRFILESIKSGLVRSAHDISEGGLVIALAECCFADRERPLGAEIKLISGLRPDFACFGESQSRVILTCKPAHQKQLAELASSHGIPLAEIGLVAGDRLKIDEIIDLPVERLADLYYESVGEAMA